MIQIIRNIRNGRFYRIAKILLVVGIFAFFLHSKKLDPTTILSLSALLTALSISLTGVITQVFQNDADGHYLRIERLYNRGDWLAVSPAEGKLVENLERVMVLDDGTYEWFVPHSVVFSTTVRRGKLPGNNAQSSNK